MATEVEIAPFPGFAALEAEWRALERRAAAPAIFQCWSWVGCLAEERFDDPVLLRARSGGRLTGLALFNRRAGRLLLTQSGDAAHDAPFIEHNAPLVATDAEADTEAALLRAAWRVPGVRRIVLGGVAPDAVVAVGGRALRSQIRSAPFADLAAIRTAGGTYLASRSANTRQQIGRSLRRYGDAALVRAETATEAQAWLDELIVLHAATWERRGKPGAFADPFMRRFHAVLVARALADDQLDLLRITSAREVIGLLYNFRVGGRIFAYQSGLSHRPDAPQLKPGLTCHTLAIEAALAAGAEVYDFLGGDDRYKQSLATSATELCWVELVRRGSLLGVAAALHNAARTLRDRHARKSQRASTT